MKKLFPFITLLIFHISIVYAKEGAAMAFPEDEEVCIFSAMKGVITFQGRSAANAKIVRRVAWKDKIGESQETTTNANGEFEFAIMNRQLKRLFPAQFVATQEITVHYDGKDYLIWAMGKLDKSEYGELGGQPQNFRCELTDDLVRIEVPAGILGSRCKWDALK